MKLPTRAGLPDFLGNVNQNNEKYTQRTQNITNGHKIYLPNVHKIFQINTKYTSIFHSKALQNIHITFGIFGMKIYHLATLYPGTKLVKSRPP
jgi:hypothetical protein